MLQPLSTAPHHEVHRERLERDAIRVARTLKQILDVQGGSASGAQLVQRVASKATASALRHYGKEASAAEPREMITCAVLAEIHLGEDWPSVEPIMLEEDAGLTPQEGMMAKAAATVLHGHEPWEHWHVFEKVAALAAGHEPDFERTQELSLVDVAWAMLEMRLIDAKTPVSDEVWIYIGHLAHHQGWAALPYPLGPATHYLMRASKDQSHAHRIERGDYSGPVGERQSELLAGANDYLDHKLKKLNDELTALLPII